MEEKQIVVIPVNIDPPIRCYLIHAYLINIIGNVYPDFSLYVISNYLSLHNGNERWRREYLDFHLANNFINICDLFIDNSWFDIVKFDNETSSKISEQAVKERIIHYLKNGYYVLHRVNEGALPNSRKYQQKQADNNALTFGYVYNDDAFFVLNYNKNGIFGPSMVSCKDYLNSLYTVTPENRLKLNFIKAKSGLTFSFDGQCAKKLLSCYINCENAYPDNPHFINNIFGYEGVERTLKEMEKGVNMIRLRTIKEHKETVLRYMDYVTKNNMLGSNFFLDKYREINNKMNTIFMKVLKKQIFVTKEGKQFVSEYDDIRRLNEKECVLLREYLRLV